jgi:hypothetical protein
MPSGMWKIIFFQNASYLCITVIITVNLALPKSTGRY